MDTRIEIERPTLSPAAVQHKFDELLAEQPTERIAPANHSGNGNVTLICSHFRY